jgi:hypothetical protein
VLIPFLLINQSPTNAIAYHDITCRATRSGWTDSILILKFDSIHCNSAKTCPGPTQLRNGRRISCFHGNFFGKLLLKFIVVELFLCSNPASFVAVAAACDNFSSHLEANACCTSPIIYGCDHRIYLRIPIQNIHSPGKSASHTRMVVRKMV